MKSKIIVLFFLSVTGLNSITGQVLSKQYIDNWVTTTFPDSRISKTTTYILNGNLLDSIGFSDMLSAYSINDISNINYLDSPGLIPEKPVSAIILISTEKQDRESIKNILKRCQAKYIENEIVTATDIDKERGEPALVINDRQIPFNECYNVIHKIKESDIVSINHIEQPVSESLYGANSVNGLILIRTKKDSSL